MRARRRSVSARLRLFYVEPFARGEGIGAALVTACVAFARAAGYAAVTLWTHTILASARRIYAAHGFAIVATAMHEEFGEPVQGGDVAAGALKEALS